MRRETLLFHLYNRGWEQKKGYSSREMEDTKEFEEGEGGDGAEVQEMRQEE